MIDMLTERERSDKQLRPPFVAQRLHVFEQSRRLVVFGGTCSSPRCALSANEALPINTRLAYSSTIWTGPGHPRSRPQGPRRQLCGNGACGADGDSGFVR